ncbi:6-phosphogluconolactonase-like [Paramacrobiotus metropolitanus]|uniref:6-phosphogluconolactonase-like n=1 Tax=Paramacrobiotus metropolitanus TaxID=2943436 RepID=UPI0024459E36|nr:6-phosphogluconolactonase-like [Paramacrobiotus metropolitanus]
MYDTNRSSCKSDFSTQGHKTDKALLFSIFFLILWKKIMADGKNISVFESSSQLEKGLTDLLKQISEKAIKDRGKFMLGVSGASMVKQLSAAIPAVYSEKGNPEWNKWHIFLCDERVLGFDDQESTFGAYKKDLLTKVPQLESQFEVIDPSQNAEKNALIYHNHLVKHFGNAIWPTFDLLLLGMGPDGHTCSLFPNHPLLTETGRAWVAPINDSPKPPPSRITLTLGVLNHARVVAFVTTGSSKADTLKEILEGGNPNKLPAGLVQPTSGKLLWLLDKEASARLTGVKMHSNEVRVEL